MTIKRRTLKDTGKVPGQCGLPGVGRAASARFGEAGMLKTGDRQGNSLVGSTLLVELI